MASRIRGVIIERSYRIYVTDSLRLIPQMASLAQRWADLTSDDRKPEKTADEIIDDVISRLEGA